MPFYVEKAADEYGNTALPRAVFEGTMGPVPWDPESGREQFTITAPPEGVKYSGFLRDSFAGFRELPESAGPARLLSRQEWAELAGWKGEL